MKISIAHPSEADALTEVAFAAKRHWGYPEAWVEHWSSILTVTPAFVAANETIAAHDDGRIIGFAAFVHDDAGLRLEHLWVLPQKMGCGVGRALFRHAQERARAMGFETFEIESDPHASGFYLRMGAKLIRTTTTVFDGEPRELPVFRCCSSK